jgi:hypothetical protein
MLSDRTTFITGMRTQANQCTSSVHNTLFLPTLGNVCLVKMNAWLQSDLSVEQNDSGCERSCVTWVAWNHQNSF